VFPLSPECFTAFGGTYFSFDNNQRHLLNKQQSWSIEKTPRKKEKASTPEIGFLRI
jgi:hypothetical protein